MYFCGSLQQKSLRWKCQENVNDKQLGEPNKVFSKKFVCELKQTFQVKPLVKISCNTLQTNQQNGLLGLFRRLKEATNGSFNFEFAKFGQTVGVDFKQEPSNVSVKKKVVGVFKW